MPDVHSLFFSYRTREAALAKPLLDALAALGVDVWRDTARTEAGDAITPAVRNALAHSRTLLAFYSDAYNDSPVCQWELATAWSAARAAGEPTDRVLLVLPPGRASPQDVHPTGGPHRPEFDAVGFRCPAADAPVDAWRELAAKLKARLDQVDDRTFQDLAMLDAPRFHLHRPDRSNRFVGRLADLWALDGLLHAGRHAIITGHADSAAQVIGMGGIGKTQLATEYAWRFASAWPGGIVWINDARRDRTDVLYDLAPSLDPALGRLTDRDARVNAADKHLHQLDKPYLWVLDNVPPDLTVDALRARSAPTIRGVTLLTTRSRTFHSLGLSHDLDRLPLADALELLTKDRPAGAEREVAEALCRDVGCHPLAIDVLRGLVAADPQLRHPFTHWRDRLARPSEDALAAADTLLADEHLPNRYVKNVAVVLQSSLDTLPEAGWDVLCAAAALAELPIPSALLEGLLAAAAGGSLADGWSLQGVEAAEARSLAKATGAGLVVHGLVSRAVRRADARSRVNRCKQVAADVMLGLLQDKADRRSPPQVTGVVEHARARVQGELDATAAVLGVRLSIHGRTRGDYWSSRALFDRALEACTTLLGPEHPDSPAALHRIAVTLAFHGELELAKGVFERALEARARILGYDHHDTLHTLLHLELTVDAHADLAGARDLRQRKLEARTMLLGPDHPDTRATLRDLALTLDAFVGYEGPLNHFQRAFEASTLHLGPEHQVTIEIKENVTLFLQGIREISDRYILVQRAHTARTRLLGPDYQDTLPDPADIRSDRGDINGARDQFTRALESSTKLLGIEHPDTLDILEKLAATLDAQGDHEGASTLYERALEARISLLGPEHPSTLATLRSFARAKYILGAGRRMLERGLESSSSIFGPEHPATLAILELLAIKWHGRRELAAARVLQERGLEASTKRFGPEHPVTLAFVEHLALTTRAEGGREEARTLEERALEAKARSLGPEHPDTLTSLQHFASTLKDDGDLNGARDLYEQALEVKTRLLGPEHPDTLATLQHLASTLKAQGDLSGARTLYEQALEANTRLRGPQHPETRATRRELALTLDAQGDLNGARILFEVALEESARRPGPEHRDTLNLLENLAITRRALGDLRGACVHYERALEVKTKLLGPEHPDTRATRFNLVLTLIDLGDLLAARPLLSAVAAIEAQPDHTLAATDRQILQALPRLRARVAALADPP